MCFGEPSTFRPDLKGFDFMPASGLAGSERNYTAYCNPELQKLFDRQSVESDQEKRKALVWEIDTAAGGRCSPDHLSQPRRHLLAAPAERAQPDGQQHL